MDSLEKISVSQVADLTVFAGIGEKLAEKMIESAKEIQKNGGAAVAPAVENNNVDAVEAEASSGPASSNDEPIKE
jgi:Holliday junction resolvasome RuvABC DNA-binding subunit